MENSRDTNIDAKFEDWWDNIADDEKAAVCTFDAFREGYKIGYDARISDHRISNVVEYKSKAILIVGRPSSPNQQKVLDDIIKKICLEAKPGKVIKLTNEEWNIYNSYTKIMHIY